MSTDEGKPAPVMRCDAKEGRYESAFAVALGAIRVAFDKDTLMIISMTGGALLLAVPANGGGAASPRLMTSVAGHCTMFTGERKRCLTMIEPIVFHHAPPGRDVTRTAYISVQRDAMGRLVARFAVLKRFRGEVRRLFSSTPSHTRMALFACHIPVFPGQRKLRDIMIESLSRFPTVGNVTIPAKTIPEERRLMKSRMA